MCRAGTDGLGVGPTRPTSTAQLGFLFFQKTSFCHRCTDGVPSAYRWIEIHPENGDERGWSCNRDNRNKRWRRTGEGAATVGGGSEAGGEVTDGLVDVKIGGGKRHFHQW